MTKVWIAYEPRIFREALVAVIRQLQFIEIVEDISKGVDIGIFRLAETGMLQDFFRDAPLPDAKMIVFSAHGDRGYIRYPREKEWKTRQPFGMPELLVEITRQD
jgi:hypothetical protein